MIRNTRIKNRLVRLKIKCTTLWRSTKKDPIGTLWILPVNNFLKRMLTCVHLLCRVFILTCGPYSADTKSNLVRLRKLYTQFKEVDGKFSAFSLDIDAVVPYHISDTMIKTSKEIMDLAYTLNQQGIPDEMLENFCPELLYIRYFVKSLLKSSLLKNKF